MNLALVRHIGHFCFESKVIRISTIINEARRGNDGTSPRDLDGSCPGETNEASGAAIVGELH